MINKSILKGFLTVCFFSLPLSACSADSDFDKVCEYFTELSLVSDVEKLSHLQKNEFIFSKINNGLDASSDAAAAWKAISSAESSQRYMLFQSAAADSLKLEWQCPAMKELASTTGEFE